MLTRKTVFVLGAGASFPFGFPTGYHLSRLIADGMVAGSNPHHYLKNVMGFNARDLQSFHDEFEKAGRLSMSQPPN
jgi:hypothetical protein